MKQAEKDKLLKYLVDLCKDVSKGRYAKKGEIFELTKTGIYPELITKLAESFGMMMVKVETREFRLEQIIDDLKKTQAELSTAREMLSHENNNLKQNLRKKFSPARILGTSRQIREILEKVERIAGTPVNVLITGETGTGKELIAKAIHYNSDRSEKPFVALNCSAIPETIFESEIFGIERGVATGVEKRMGKVEQASGGTIFLDEIGDMPKSSQSKILRVIEERELERVGGRKAIPVDIRIIAATNQDLKKEVKKRNFREDLFYRLNVINLHMPPLRERKDDIPLLLNSFMEEYSRKLGKKKMHFSPEVTEHLKEYPWPGNVRELENEVERAVVLAYSGTIAINDLSGGLRNFIKGESTAENQLHVKESEKRLIKKALAESGGNKTEAAKKLGVSREGLRKKIKRYGLD